MKKILTFMLFAAAALAGFAAGDKDKVNVEFDSTTYDFGTIGASAEPVSHVYTMTNTGDEAVSIYSVSTSCGCTRPDYPKKPVNPGEKAGIKVKFLPAGQKSGEISRNIRVKLRSASGKKRNITLRISGVVVPEK